MKKLLLVTALCFVPAAYACGVKGSVVNSDGSKVDGTSAVTTSWNSKKAFPKNGSYSLDLGDGVCGKTITVYLDGNNGQKVRVDGWATVDFVRR